MQTQFSIIGTGNMAWFLAEKLCAAGHHFEGVFGRNLIAANELAAHYSGSIYTTPDEIQDTENHCCFIAVKDTAIAAIAAQLRFKKTILIHTAGASSIHLLQHGAQHYGAFWPIYSIVKTNHFLPNNIPIAVEGNDALAEQNILQLANSISGQAFPASETQRLSLHLSAVFANNFTNHLLAIAEDICAHENISFDYLKPILNQTFERLNSQSAKQSQTGPAIRGDETTMQQHLELLKTRQDLSSLYQTLSMSIRKMYEDGAQ